MQHFLSVGLQVDHDVQAPFTGHFCQRLGLAHVAGEAVEDEPGWGVRSEQVLPDHSHHDVVGHELAPVHVGLERAAELGAAPGRGPEGIARRDVGHAVDGSQARRLGPLARPLAPQDNYAGRLVRGWLSFHRRNPS